MPPVPILHDYPFFGFLLHPVIEIKDTQNLISNWVQIQYTPYALVVYITILSIKEKNKRKSCQQILQTHKELPPEEDTGSSVFSNCIRAGSAITALNIRVNLF